MAGADRVHRLVLQTQPPRQRPLEYPLLQRGLIKRGGRDRRPPHARGLFELANLEARRRLLAASVGGVPIEVANLEFRRRMPVIRVGVDDAARLQSDEVGRQPAPQQLGLHDDRRLWRRVAAGRGRQRTAAVGAAGVAGVSGGSRVGRRARQRDLPGAGLGQRAGAQHAALLQHERRPAESARPPGPTPSTGMRSLMNSYRSSAVVEQTASVALQVVAHRQCAASPISRLASGANSGGASTTNTSSRPLGVLTTHLRRPPGRLRDPALASTTVRVPVHARRFDRGPTTEWDRGA